MVSGVDGIDTDLPTALEGKVVRTPVRKAVWMSLQALFYAVRPLLVVEVHLTNTAARGADRARALVGEACWARVEGFGAQGYHLALRALVERAKDDVVPP